MIIEDSDGNTLNIADGKKKTVKLTLVASNRQRHLGEIIEIEGRTIFKTSRNAIHVFRKYNAFGFNKLALEEIKPEAIIVKFEGNDYHEAGDYMISYEDYEEVGIPWLDSSCGFEEQVFVPIEEMTVRV